MSGEFTDALINFADEPSRAIFRRLSGVLAPHHFAAMNAFGGLNNGCALRSELGFMRGGDWRQSDPVLLVQELLALGIADFLEVLRIDPVERIAIDLK